MLPPDPHCDPINDNTCNNQFFLSELLPAIQKDHGIACAVFASFAGQMTDRCVNRSFHIQNLLVVLVLCAARAGFGQFPVRRVLTYLLRRP